MTNKEINLEQLEKTNGGADITTVERRRQNMQVLLERKLEILQRQHGLPIRRPTRDELVLRRIRNGQILADDDRKALQ